MPGSVRTTNYLQSVAKGYLVSAEFHERKALSAAAQGDDIDVHTHAARQFHDLIEGKMAGGVQAVRKKNEHLPPDLGVPALRALEFLEHHVEAVV